MTGIEFGGGDHPRRPDFAQCDVRPLPGVAYCCAAWQIDTLVPHGSVDEIYSRHFFEHLTFAQGRDFLGACWRILRAGGRIEMWMPNIDWHIQQWQTGSNLDWARAGFWGWQRDDGHGDWDVHKSGYNFAQLGELVADMGYVDYRSIKANRRHLAVEFFKH